MQPSMMNELQTLYYTAASITTVCAEKAQFTKFDLFISNNLVLIYRNLLTSALLTSLYMISW